jgi:hypothetical protein
MRPAEDDRPAPDRPRIFGIGLNKTATSSLHDALTILGFNSLHDGGPTVHDAVLAAIDAEQPLLSNLDPRVDAFSDIGLLSRRFGILDRQYPGSRFILTVRPLDAWIDSRRRHVARNVADKAIGEYDGTFLVVDEPKWIEEWEHHTERVRTYFAGRTDFLEIDLTHSPSWGPICDLLGLAEPESPFPWANRDPALHDAGAGPATGS